MVELRQKGIAEINGTTLPYEVAGTGHPLVLNHGGLVDNRLWDEQFDEFAKHFQVIRYDMRGFGEAGLLKQNMAPFSFEEDLHSLLQFLGIEKTAVLGLSMGGSLSIDFTLQYPEMVDALITVGAGLSGFEPGEPDEALNARFAETTEAFKNGDIARAVEITLRLWTDGLYRTPEQTDPQARERVRIMTTHNFERPDDQEVRPKAIQPPAVGRLAEIQVPTLIIVGSQDMPLILNIADLLKKEIVGAKLVSIPNTAHHPNVEKPAEFNRAVIEFLEQAV
jgi:3-oxoadipate enol-lactonase